MTPQIDSSTIEWTPTARQSDFLSLPDEIFEAFYGGAAGGGKSDTLLFLPLVRKFIEHPRFKGLLLRRTFPELEKELIQRSLYWYKLAGGSYNSQKHFWTFPSGAIIQFGYCEHDNDVRQYDSAEYSYIGFDELTSFTYWMYSYIAFTRCRAPGGTSLPSIIRSGSNPGNVGHAWAKDRFVNPCKTGYKIIEREILVRGEKKVSRCIFIPSRVDDNPHTLKTNPNYIVNLSMLPAAEREAKLEGNWDAFEGQAFEEFRNWPEGEQVYKEEPANYRHTIDSFDIPSYWPRVLSIDWGYAAMMCAGDYAINPLPSPFFPSKIYKVREYTCKKTLISTWASKLEAMFRGINLVDRVIDPSAQQHRGDQFTIKQQVEQSFGDSFRLADNDRISGKLLLGEYLRCIPKIVRKITRTNFNQDEANEINRRLGPLAYQEYCSAFIPEQPESFLPKFQMTYECVETIRAILACTYAKGSKGTNVEDVEAFDGDDPYDETRYGLKACQNYLDGGLVVAQKEVALSQLQAEVEETGNKFEYHYKMQKLEKKFNNVFPQPVRQHRHRRTSVR